jgi:hypothetical protein
VPSSLSTASPTCDYLVIDAKNNEVTTPANVPIDIKVLEDDILSLDQSPLEVVNILSTGSHGTCEIVENGTIIRYTPEEDYYGSDRCIYTACDTKDRCDSASVVINVIPIIATDDTATTEITTPVWIYPLQNDTALAGTISKVVSIKNPAKNGHCVIVNSETVVYIPNPNFNGVDTCEYNACVDGGFCDTAIIAITVTGTPCDDEAPLPTTNPTAAPTPCEPRTFHFSNGICSNADLPEDIGGYATLRECCNDKFDEGCCKFEDVCFHDSEGTGQPDFGVFETSQAPNEMEAESFEEKTSPQPWTWKDKDDDKKYIGGDKVVGEDGKIYECLNDFAAYCNWEEFKPPVHPHFWQLAWKLSERRYLRK